MVDAGSTVKVGRRMGVQVYDMQVRILPRPQIFLTSKPQTMTHQHTSNGREWLMVEVPSEAYNFEGCRDGCSSILEYQLAPDELTGQGIQLPSGTWRIHSDSQTITEEQAGEIVEKGHKDNHSMWIDYQCADWACMTPTESYHSILRSLNINSQVINLVRI